MWQQLIWREWRYSNDPDYSAMLYDLVADEAVGWGSQLTLTLFAAIAGATVGILIVAPFTLAGTILQQVALAGFIVGAVRGALKGRQLTWRSWIRRLEANTPSGNAGRFVAGAVLLALLGGMVFGPLFWLVMIGLFWLAGDLITWLNSTLEETQPFSPADRRFWFWWRPRPALEAILKALHFACIASGEARAMWSHPLSEATSIADRTTQPELLIDRLLSDDWAERFVARCHLIQLGQEAVYPLQAAARQQGTPLHDTALWLLESIERS